jgi:hypothetical protein
VLIESDDDYLVTLATNDPSIFRDVAAAYLSDAPKPDASDVWPLDYPKIEDVWQNIQSKIRGEKGRIQGRYIRRANDLLARYIASGGELETIDYLLIYQAIPLNEIINRVRLFFDASRAAGAPKPDASDLEHLASDTAARTYPNRESEHHKALAESILAALAEARTAGVAAERERCAKIAVSWQRADAIKLAAGEMTAQELRTAKAVAGGIERAILAPNPTSTTASLSSSA